MRRLPTSRLERELWDAWARFVEAQARGTGVSPADEEVRGMLCAYLAVGPEGRRAVRSFLFAIDAELADRERERRDAVLFEEQADRDRARVRHHVRQVMRVQGLDRLEMDPGLLYFGPGHDELVVADPAKLPDELVRVIPAKREPIEKTVREALAAGKSFPGVFLRPGEKVLVLR